MNQTSSSLYQVIIIDDDISFRKLLEKRLHAFIQGLSVSAFGTLKETRNFLKENLESPIDLVILDEHLPDGRGLDLLQEGWFQDLSVLSVSSDDAPEIPGALLRAGAAYFLSKVQVSEPLFKPLVLGLLDGNKLRRELNEAKIKAAVMDTVKILVSTLRHEINNPLGAVLGAAYLIRTQESASAEQKQAAELVESSGHRIKHVLDELCEAMRLEPIKKANQEVFHIPGDKPWESGKE